MHSDLWRQPCPVMIMSQRPPLSYVAEQVVWQGRRQLQLAPIVSRVRQHQSAAVEAQTRRRRERGRASLPVDIVASDGCAARSALHAQLVHAPS